MNRTGMAKKGGKEITTYHNHQMHTVRTSAGEAILPDPSLEKDTPHESWPQTVLLSKLQKRLDGNYDSLISCPFVVIVYKYPHDTLCAFERAIDYTQGLLTKDDFPSMHN